MNIYLYVKTHLKTGLKYLGKTTAKDPHKYNGSGVYWTNHLRIHGQDYSTEILRECKSKEEVAEWGLYYSNLWDIVNARDINGDKLWANLINEVGDGGKTNGFAGKHHTTSAKRKLSESNIGKVVSIETRQKIAKANIGKLKNPHTDETKKKISDAVVGRKLSDEHKLKIGTAQIGKIVTAATKEKMSLSKKGKAPPNKGKQHSEETKQKISTAAKLRHINNVKR
jgi:hypothetical protein